MSNEDRREYDSLVAIYQINDRSSALATGEAAVRTDSRERWIRHVRNSCDVLKMATSRAVVVTAHACCFPAYAGVSAAYDEEVRQLRGILTEEGIPWLDGAQLQCLPTNDGVHFDCQSTTSIVGAVATWLQCTTPIGVYTPAFEAGGNKRENPCSARCCACV